jgi:hypothetical protein
MSGVTQRLLDEEAQRKLAGWLTLAELARVFGVPLSLLRSMVAGGSLTLRADGCAHRDAVRLALGSNVSRPMETR